MVRLQGTLVVVSAIVTFLSESADSETQSQVATNNPIYFTTEAAKVGKGRAFEKGNNSAKLVLNLKENAESLITNEPMSFTTASSGGHKHQHGRSMKKSKKKSKVKTSTTEVPSGHKHSHKHGRGMKKSKKKSDSKKKSTTTEAPSGHKHQHGRGIKKSKKSDDKKKSKKSKEKKASNGTKKDFRQVALEDHNKYRAMHGAKNLTLSDKLNESAQKCAEHLAKNNIFKHVCKGLFKIRVGENLSWRTTNSKTKAAKSAVKAWYDEVKLYDYKKPGFSSETGHFTQVVWKDSKKLGIGAALNNGKLYIVAHYEPPGNMNYKVSFQKNVLPKQ